MRGIARCGSLPAPFMIIIPILFFITSCGLGKRSERGTFGPPPEVSIVASVDGVDADDLGRTDLRYDLLCDGLEPIAGDVIEKDGEKNILFKNDLLKNGLSCSLEVRGPVADGIEWLTQPADEGLYYASTKEVIEKSKLQPTLYKVYRLRDDDPALDPVVVSTLEGGLCQSFSMAERRCLDVEEPREEEPIDEEPIDEEPAQTEARVRELFGFDVVDGDRVDGFQATISGIEQTFQNGVMAPLPGTIAAELRLRNNMTVLFVDKVEIADKAQFYAEMEKALTAKAGAKVLLVTKLGREPSYHMLPIPNSENVAAN